MMMMIIIIAPQLIIGPHYAAHHHHHHLVWEKEGDDFLSLVLSKLGSERKGMSGRE